MSIQLPADSVRRILVLRANGLGDFLFATPALRALTKHFASAEVTFLCLPWMKPFIDGRYPYLHRVRPIPPIPGIRNPIGDPKVAESHLQSFIDSCRAYDFDLAIQMQGGGGQSNPFLRQLGARLTVGLTGVGVPRLDVNVSYQFYQHEILRYVEVVSKVGATSDGLTMDAPELDEDLHELRSAWPDYARTPYVVVHVGASDSRRRWPIERFAAVADFVNREHGIEVVATGSLADRPLVCRLSETSAVRIIDLSGRLSLGAVASLVRRAALILANDTGISNLAFSVDAPAVVVYWCGNLITAGPFFRGRHRPVLSWTVDCPACGRRKCSCRVSFVAEAPLDEVLAHVDDLLRHPSSDKPAKLLQ